MTEPDPEFLPSFRRGGGEVAARGLAWLGASAREPRVLAEILATVESERALAELGVAADEIPNLVATAALDPLLGARVIILPPQAAGEPSIALAEPSTEGRVAATLARHGEGRIGRYVASPVTLDDVRARAATAGIPISRPADGPFGREILVLDGPVTGPHLILCDPVAVPSPS